MLSNVFKRFAHRLKMSVKFEGADGALESTLIDGCELSGDHA